MMENKKSFRKRYKEIRSKIETEKKERENQDIFLQFINLDEYKKASTVFIYVSFGDEVDTLGLIKKALEDKKYVAVPVCDKESHIMSPALIKDITCLREGAYGILEPFDNYDVVENDSIDVTVVPGLCFSTDGSRMGYGGGYYDRFLKEYKGFSVGFAFSDCMAENIPNEEYDRKVDLVISGKRK